jgi:ribonuclease PH
LERYPRCVIQVLIQIVQADGCVLGSAVNCAVLALMDAGVAMGGLPVASTCVVIPCYNVYDGAVRRSNSDAGGEQKGGSAATTIWLDPTAEEESGEGHAIAVHVTDMAEVSSALIPGQSSTGQGSGIITSFTFGAPLSLQGLLSSVESTKQSSAATVAFMRLAIKQKVQREVQTLWS